MEGILKYMWPSPALIGGFMNAVQAIIGVISKTLPIVNGVTTLLGVRKTD